MFLYGLLMKSLVERPDLISSALHRSVDGTKVAMYAQWRSIEDYEAMRRNRAPLPRHRKV
jgi:hypothetical protein